MLFLLSSCPVVTDAPPGLGQVLMKGSQVTKLLPHPWAPPKGQRRHPTGRTKAQLCDLGHHPRLRPWGTRCWARPPHLGTVSTRLGGRGKRRELCRTCQFSPSAFIVKTPSPKPVFGERRRERTELSSAPILETQLAACDESNSSFIWEFQVKGHGFGSQSKSLNQNPTPFNVLTGISCMELRQTSQSALRKGPIHVLFCPLGPPPTCVLCRWPGLALPVPETTQKPLSLGHRLPSPGGDNACLSWWPCLQPRGLCQAHPHAQFQQSSWALGDSRFRRAPWTVALPFPLGQRPLYKARQRRLTPSFFLSHFCRMQLQSNAK